MVLKSTGLGPLSLVLATLAPAINPTLTPTPDERGRGGLVSNMVGLRESLDNEFERESMVEFAGS